MGRLDNKKARIFGELAGLILGISLLLVAYNYWSILVPWARLILVAGGVGSLIVDGYLLWKTILKKQFRRK